MGGKEAFHTLPPEIRAMALVGHYLQSFALMEAEINAAISKALKLESVQGLIVCKNISFRDKIHILRTLIDISLVDSATKQRHDAFLNTVTGYAADRNMVAHDLFMADESMTGVEFLVTKAKGKLRFPTTVWTVDEVEEKCDKLESARVSLKELSTLFKRADIIKALLQSPESKESPIAGLFGLAGSFSEDHQPQSSPDVSSQETNLPQDPQNPQR